ncbi:DUF5666 domain-containing protein [Polaromonas sp. P2-4]|nr:DUF5666 domain-containing protein [Polaromonas sp. P2-4]
MQVIHAAVGPLEAPDTATGAFRILGQTARALNPDDLSGLKAGDWVRVSGHRLAQGEIAASRIEPIAAQPQAQLNGSVGSIDADSLMVNGTRVRFGAQPLPAGLAPGREVLISGSWDGSTLQAERVQPDPTRDGLGRVERVVFEGYVHTLGERELSLGLGPLTLSPDMQIVGGSAAQLAVNRRVQVSGRVGADQRVTIERLELRNGADGSDRGDRDRRSGSQRGSDSSRGKGSSGGSGSSGDSGSSGRSGSSGDSGSSGGSGGSGGSGSGGGSGGGSGSGK